MKLPYRKAGLRIGPDAILEGLTTAVICLDANLRIAMLNTACENLFGVSARIVRHHSLATAIPHFAPLEQRLRESLEAGSGFIERELELRRNGDRPLTVDCTATPVLSGKHRGMLLELSPLERHLRISRDEHIHNQFDNSRELIRGLAHEIKNPLGGIRGSAQLLEHELPDEQHREYTQVIIREADRLQKLVDRLLGPSRRAQRESMNVHEVLEHVRQLVDAESGAGVEVLRDYDPSIPEIEGDREQLIQALLNIARNALQAVGDAGTIRLRTRARRRVTLNGQVHRLAVVVEIEDDGPGISHDMLEKVFYPMVTTRADGSGLGLPIAQVMAHAHGGTIECHSEPGSTVFALVLPLETPQ